MHEAVYFQMARGGYGIPSIGERKIRRPSMARRNPTFNAPPASQSTPPPMGFVWMGSNPKTSNAPERQGGFDTLTRSNLTLADRERDGIDIHV